MSHKRSDALYCSEECYRRSDRTRRINREAMRRYLARKRAATAGKPPRLCGWCGRNIDHRHRNALYCDQKCWWKHHSSIPENRQRRRANSRRHKAENPGPPPRSRSRLWGSGPKSRHGDRHKWRCAGNGDASCAGHLSSTGSPKRGSAPTSAATGHITSARSPRTAGIAPNQANRRAEHDDASRPSCRNRCL